MHVKLLSSEALLTAQNAADIVESPSEAEPGPAGGAYVKNSGKVLPQYFDYGSVSWQDNYESNFACYNCINGITSTVDEYNFASYNCISNITICGRTVEEDYLELTNPVAGLRPYF